MAVSKPAFNPVTVAKVVPETSVAVTVLLIDHVPPKMASLMVVETPTQIVVFPDIGPVGFTVTVTVALAPAAE